MEGIWMQVTENPVAAHQLLEKVRAKDSDRAPGLHVSDLLYCQRKAWARMHHPGYNRVESDDDTLIFLLGRGHHELLEQDIPESKTWLLLNGEVVHASIDGIEWYQRHTFLDGHVEYGGTEFPVEFKTTRKSSKNSVVEQSNYIEQLAAYCLTMGATHGRLYVLYISGDYKPPKPQIKAFEIEFELGELLRWKEELEDRHQAIQDRDNFPSLIDHYSWECERCPVKELLSCPGGKGRYDGGFFHTTQLPWDITSQDGNLVAAGG